MLAKRFVPSRQERVRGRHAQRLCQPDRGEDDQTEQRII